MSVIAKRGYDLYVLVAATTATNGHAVNNLDKTVTKLSPHASLGCGHTGQSHGRGPVQSKPELELLSIYIANGTLPDTLESVLEECSIAAIYVHHCWNLKLAHKIQHRVSSAFGNQPAIFCESHDIQSRGSYILNGRQSQAEKTISLEESEAAEIDLCKLADCMVHINRDDFRFFHDRLPQGRHALLPPTIAPESETALRALRDEVDPAASKLIYVAAPNYWNAVTTCWLLEKVMPRVDGMRENFLIFGGIAHHIKKERPDIYDAFSENFAGHMASIKDVYVNAKAVLVPALGGTGSSIKLREAMCVGRPTVGTPETTRGLDSESISRLPITIAEGEAEFAAAVEKALKASHATPLQPMVDMYDQEMSGEIYRTRLDHILESVLDDIAPQRAIDSDSTVLRRIFRRVKSYWSHRYD